MNRSKVVLVVLFLFVSFICFADKDKGKTNDEPPVSSSFEGKFIYKGYSPEDVTIFVDADKHTEVYNNGEYKVVSKIKWISETTMQLEILENNLPESNIGIGDMMSIEIERSKGEKYYYISTLKDKSWRGCMVKVE